MAQALGKPLPRTIKVFKMLTILTIICIAIGCYFIIVRINNNDNITNKQKRNYRIITLTIFGLIELYLLTALLSYILD